MIMNRKQEIYERKYKDDKFNIVFFWKQNDTDLYGRRQDMLIKYLAQSPKVNKIVHFDAPMEVGSLLRKLNLSKERKVSETNLVFLHTVSRMLGLKKSPKIKYYTFVYSSNKPNRLLARFLMPKESDYLSYLKTVLERNKFWEHRTIFWVCPKNFEFPAIVSGFNPNLILADVIDDHRGWYENSNPEVNRLTENYREILGLSDIVLANCQSIKDTMSAFSDNIHVVPNACELPESNVNYNLPKDLKRIKRPIIGYIGNLSSRIDIPLLEYVATMRPHWSIVLIGSAHASKEILKLETYKNIHFLGVKKYNIVRQYVSNFDVAIIPHLNNELSRSMNPLKTFVYCSMNVPVVSTEIYNLDELLDLIYIAHDKHEFIEKIELALSKKKSEGLNEEHINLLKKNCWEERVAQVLSLINEKLS